MTRTTFAVVLSLVLTAIPFALIIALVVALGAGLDVWWTFGIVAVGYGFAAGSKRLTRIVSDSIADASPSELTPSQRELIQSADAQVAEQRWWLRFVFPTLLLGLALAGHFLSLRTAMMILMGVGVLGAAWLITSIMLMWPLHRQIDRERRLSQRQQLIRQVAIWSLYAVFWLVAVGALVMWIGSSLTFAIIWGISLALGAGLAIWKRPLIWQAATDESANPAS